MFPEIPVMFVLLMIAFWPLLLLTHGVLLALGVQALWLALLGGLLAAWFRSVRESRREAMTPAEREEISAEARKALNRLNGRWYRS